MRNIRLGFSLAVLAGLLLAGVVQAQDSELGIFFSRDYGYSSGGGDIQGVFTVTASGPEDLAHVVFYIDDQVLGEVDQAPFKLQFSTGDHPLGLHSLHAAGMTADGRQLESPVIQANFVSPDEGMKAVGRIAIPILVIVFGTMLVAALVPMVTGRRTTDLPAGTQRSYPLGGAICPKCGRPFAVHIYGINLPLGKYDRCPYCGKWSLVRYAPLDKLRAAEQAELAKAAADGAGQVQGMTEDEKLKRELDESRYHDL